MSETTYDLAWQGDAEIDGPKSTDTGEDEAPPGRYPRMVVLEEETRDRLKQWIDDEIEQFNSERQPLLSQWEDWQALYWAEPEEEVKNFPFEKAANIVVPLAAIAIEAIHARMMNTLFSVEPFWSIRPRSKEWVDAAKPMEKYLQSEAENGQTLNVYGFCNNSLLELIKLGTAVGKSGYKREMKKSLRSVGGIESEFYAETYNGATLERVPLANYIQRFSELDPQTAALTGELHEVSWGQLKRMAQSGQMWADKVDEIKTYWRQARQTSEVNDGESVQAKVEEIANVEPLWTERFKFYELWVSFDVDGDGWNEEIVLDYHKESGTFLSIRYNWYSDLHRPYHVANFLNVEGIWPGIGVCKQSEQFQHEATTIHRQRLDNATLANMSMIVIKKGADYGPGEPIFPGKQWFLDDISDIAPLKLSEVYPSSYNNEGSVVSYYEKRTGVNEVILGLPHEGTPGTATGDLTRLAEGNKRFDLVLKNVRRWLSALGTDVVSNYQIFGNQQAHWYVLGEEGQWVEQVLNLPAVLIRRGAIVDLSVTDSITNRDVEQRQWLQLFQVITGYYDRVLQLAQIMGDPEVFGQIAQQALIASDEAMTRLLDTFTITDPDKFLLAAGSQNGNGTTGAQGGSPPGLIGGPSGGPQNTPDTTGMAGV